jgi:hypothetical protein
LLRPARLRRGDGLCRLRAPLYRHVNRAAGALEGLRALLRDGGLCNTRCGRIRATSIAEETSRALRVPHGLANALLAQQKLAEAESVLREVLAIRERVPTKGDYRIAVTRSAIDGTLMMQKRYAEAEPLLLSAYESPLDSDRVRPLHPRFPPVFRRSAHLGRGGSSACLIRTCSPAAPVSTYSRAPWPWTLLSMMP